MCSLFFTLNHARRVPTRRSIYIPGVSYGTVSVFFFEHPFYYLRTSFSFLLFELPPYTRNSDPGSLSRLFSPVPTTVYAPPFYRDMTRSSTLFYLIDSHRVSIRVHPFTKNIYAVVLDYTTHGAFPGAKKLCPRNNNNSYSNAYYYCP